MTSPLPTATTTPLVPHSNGHPSANGSPSPTPPAVSVPKARLVPARSGRGRGRLLWFVGVPLALLFGAAGVAAFFYFRPPAARADILTHKVQRGDLHLTVTEKGTLESGNNWDVVCKVRAGNKGFSTSINWVIDDGTLVKKNQLIMVLDDSDLQDKYRAQKIVVDTAQNAKTNADQQYLIVLKQNEIDVSLAESKVGKTELALDKYTGHKSEPALVALAAAAGAASMIVESGEYRQLLDDVTGKFHLAEGDVEQNRERAAWAERMVKMRYMSASQAQAERSRLDSSLETMRSLQKQRDLLIDYTRRGTLTDLRSERDDANKLLEMAHRKAQATEIQFDKDRQTKKSILIQEEDKLKDIEDQLKECKIHAQQDGMVVYYKSESSRFSANQQGMIEQGAQVKEGQKMLRIPDLRRMMVNTKVHEAMVARIKGDVRRSTGFFDSVRAGLLANPDPLSRLVSVQEDVLEAVRTNYRRKENTIASRGQKASVRIDAMPDRVLDAHVRSVAAVASQQDFFASDVKLYATLVMIDETVEGLKPDMTAEVTIHVDSAKEQVLAIPLQAVVGGAEMGAARKVFVRTADGYEERAVALGLANEKVVEVREGLAEGDEVVLNPKAILGDKAKTRDVDESKQRSGDKGGDGKGGDPSKAGKKKKGGGPPPMP